MLKSRRGVSACSIISCRIRAEALARAFNTRLWPCSWLPQSSSADAGMSNGIEDDEQFFDASPSPVDVEDDSLFCQHTSAATEAGKAKLYELLEQHATDDAIDVFYDVSEDAGVTDNTTCFRDNEKQPEQVFCESPKICKVLDMPIFIDVDSCGGDIDVNELRVSSRYVGEDVFISSETISSNGLQNCHDGVQNVIDCTAALTLESSDFSEIQNCHKETREVTHPDESLPSSTNINDHLSNGKLISEANVECEENEIKLILMDENATPVQEDQTTSNKELTPNFDDETSEKLNESADASDLLFSTFTDDINIGDEESRAMGSDADPNFVSEDKALDIKNESNVTIEVIGSNSPSPTSETKPIISPNSSRLQVFDEPRPKISRTTSLKTGKTPPGTPSRKKIVRFADVLGLDLEDVHHIMTGDLPIIPSSAYTDLVLNDIDLPTCEPILKTVEIRSRQTNCWNTLQGATATNVLYPAFTIPGELPNFLDRVRAQGICLESVLVSEMSVQCTCRVMNYGYHKKVLIRYTVNDWVSTTDIDALYVQGSSTEDMDTFAFSIFLSPSNRNPKFALKYSVNGKEYWDNNVGQNYCLSYHGNNEMQNVSNSWQHQFW